MPETFSAQKVPVAKPHIPVWANAPKHDRLEVAWGSSNLEDEEDAVQSAIEEMCEAWKAAAGGNVHIRPSLLFVCVSGKYHVPTVCDMIVEYARE